jgi:hypothetical protein
MRNLFLFLLCAFLIVPMIPNDMNAQTTKYPLIEEFTGQWCQWCPYGADSVESILNWVTESRALAYHDNSNGIDSMATTEGGAVQSSFSISSFPNAMIDRMLWSLGGGQYTYGLSRTIWGEAASAMALSSGWMSLSFNSGVYDTVKRSVWIKVDATALKRLNGEYWLNFVVSEDSVKYAQKICDPDGSNVRVEWPVYHMNVVRKMATSYGGTKIASNGINNAQKITTNVSWLNMSSTWKRKDLKLTAFVTRTDTVYKNGNPVFVHDAVQQTVQIALNDVEKFTPVSLLSFYAKEMNGKVNVAWTTEREANNNGWYLERSANLGAWEKLAFVAGHGTTSLTQMYEFNDAKVELGGKYKYRLRQMDFDGTETLSDIAYVMMGGLPTTTRLLQNYPNPFNPSTTLTIELATPSYLNLDVYDEMGRKVATLASGDYTAGVHFIQWYGTDDGKNVLPAGVYYARLATKNGIQNMRMTIAK